MTEYLPWVVSFPGLAILFILFAVVVAMFGYILEARREKAFRALAAQLGLTYQGTVSGNDLPGLYAPLELLDRGHSRRARHLMTGQLDGADVMVCAYQYMTGSGKSQSFHLRGLAMLKLGMYTPRVLVRREGLGDRLAALAGFEDIDFESDQFSRQYYVKCADRRFAYELIDPQMMEFLLANDYLQWEVSSGWLAAWREDELDVNEVPPLLEALEGFRRRIPRLVVEESKS
jgi:hypothetical protein